MRRSLQGGRTKIQRVSLSCTTKHQSGMMTPSPMFWISMVESHRLRWRTSRLSMITIVSRALCLWGVGTALHAQSGRDSALTVVTWASLIEICIRGFNILYRSHLLSVLAKSVFYMRHFFDTNKSCNPLSLKLSLRLALLSAHPLAWISAVKFDEWACLVGISLLWDRG